MRYSILLIICLAGSYGCKTTSHSESEDKFIRPIKYIIGKLDDKTLKSIKHLASQLQLPTLSKKGIDNMRRLITKGGKTADKAILAYRQGHAENLTDWLVKVGELSRKRESFAGKYPAATPKAIESLKDIDTQILNLTSNALGAFRKHPDQIEEIIKGIPLPTIEKISIVQKLRADEMIQSNTGIFMSKQSYPEGKAIALAFEKGANLQQGTVIDMSDKIITQFVNGTDRMAVNNTFKYLIKGETYLDEKSVVKFKKTMTDWIDTNEKLPSIRERLTKEHTKADPEDQKALEDYIQQIRQ